MNKYSYGFFLIELLVALLTINIAIWFLIGFYEHILIETSLIKNSIKAIYYIKKLEDSFLNAGDFAIKDIIDESSNKNNSIMKINFFKLPPLYLEEVIRPILKEKCIASKVDSAIIEISIQSSRTNKLISHFVIKPITILNFKTISLMS